MTKNELNEPVEDGSRDAGQGERIDGIVEQVRQDRALGNSGDDQAMLRQRLGDAGIRVSEAELKDLAARVARP